MGTCDTSPPAEVLSCQKLEADLQMQTAQASVRSLQTESRPVPMPFSFPRDDRVVQANYRQDDRLQCQQEASAGMVRAPFQQREDTLPRDFCQFGLEGPPANFYHRNQPSTEEHFNHMNQTTLDQSVSQFLSQPAAETSLYQHQSRVAPDAPMFRQQNHPAPVASLYRPSHLSVEAPPFCHQIQPPEQSAYLHQNQPPAEALSYHQSQPSMDAVLYQHQNSLPLEATLYQRPSEGPSYQQPSQPTPETTLYNQNAPPVEASVFHHQNQRSAEAPLFHNPNQPGPEGPIYQNVAAVEAAMYQSQRSVEASMYHHQNQPPAEAPMYHHPSHTSAEATVYHHQSQPQLDSAVYHLQNQPHYVHQGPAAPAHTTPLMYHQNQTTNEGSFYRYQNQAGATSFHRQNQSNAAYYHLQNQTTVEAQYHHQQSQPTTEGPFHLIQNQGQVESQLQNPETPFFSQQNLSAVEPQNTAAEAQVFHYSNENSQGSQLRHQNRPAVDVPMYQYQGRVPQGAQLRQHNHSAVDVPILNYQNHGAHETHPQNCLAGDLPMLHYQNQATQEAHLHQQGVVVAKAPVFHHQNLPSVEVQMHRLNLGRPHSRVLQHNLEGTELKHYGQKMTTGEAHHVGFVKMPVDELQFQHYTKVVGEPNVSDQCIAGCEPQTPMRRKVTDKCSAMQVDTTESEFQVGHQNAFVSKQNHHYFNNGGIEGSVPLQNKASATYPTSQESAPAPEVVVDQNDFRKNLRSREPNSSLTNITSRLNSAVASSHNRVKSLGASDSYSEEVGSEGAEDYSIRVQREVASKSLVMQVNKEATKPLSTNTESGIFNICKNVSYEHAEVTCDPPEPLDNSESKSFVVNDDVEKLRVQPAPYDVAAESNHSVENNSAANVSHPMAAAEKILPHNNQPMKSDDVLFVNHPNSVAVADEPSFNQRQSPSNSGTSECPLQSQSLAEAVLEENQEEPEGGEPGLEMDYEPLSDNSESAEDTVSASNTHLLPRPPDILATLPVNTESDDECSLPVLPPAHRSQPEAAASNVPCQPSTPSHSSEESGAGASCQSHQTSPQLVSPASHQPDSLSAQLSPSGSDDSGPALSLPFDCSEESDLPPTPPTFSPHPHSSPPTSPPLLTPPCVTPPPSTPPLSNPRSSSLPPSTPPPSSTPSTPRSSTPPFASPLSTSPSSPFNLQASQDSSSASYESMEKSTLFKLQADFVFQSETQVEEKNELLEIDCQAQTNRQTAEEDFDLDQSLGEEPPKIFEDLQEQTGQLPLMLPIVTDSAQDAKESAVEKKAELLPQALSMQPQHLLKHTDQSTDELHVPIDDEPIQVRAKSPEGQSQPHIEGQSMTLQELLHTQLQVTSLETQMQIEEYQDLFLDPTQECDPQEDVVNQRSGAADLIHNLSAMHVDDNDTSFSEAAVDQNVLMQNGQQSFSEPVVTSTTEAVDLPVSNIEPQLDSEIAPYVVPDQQLPQHDEALATPAMPIPEQQAPPSMRVNGLHTQRPCRLKL